MNQGWTTEVPFAPLAPGEHRYLAIDGACLPSGIRGLYGLGVSDAPVQVLADGVHDALAPLGPLLLPLDDNRELAGHWCQRHPALVRAVVIHTGMTQDELVAFFRARVQVRLADERVVWLRLADASVVARLANAGNLLPANFWNRVTSLSYGMGQATVRHYQPTVANPGSPETTTVDGTALIQPGFRFSDALAQALSDGSFDHHEEKAPNDPHTEVL